MVSWTTEVASSCSASDAGSFSPHGSALAEESLMKTSKCWLLLVATRCYTMVFRPSWIKQNMQNRKIQAESQLQAVAAIATWRLKWKSICLPPCLRRFMGILMRFPRLKRSQLTRKNRNYGSTVIAHAIFPNLFANSKVQQWLLNPSSVISSYFLGGCTVIQVIPPFINIFIFIYIYTLYTVCT